MFAKIVFFRLHTGCDLLLQYSLRTGYLVVLLEDVGQRSNRCDGKLVDLPVALRVVIPDVFELCRLLTEGLWIVPVQMSDPLVQVRISRPTEMVLAMSKDRTEHAVHI